MSHSSYPFFSPQVPTSSLIQFICTKCGEVFNSHSDLARHQDAFHGERIKYECYKCKFVSDDLRTWNSHFTVCSSSSGGGGGSGGADLASRGIGAGGGGGGLTIPGNIQVKTSYLCAIPFCSFYFVSQHSVF